MSYGQWRRLLTPSLEIHDYSTNAFPENLGDDPNTYQARLDPDHKFISQERDCIMFSLDMATEEDTQFEAECRVPFWHVANIKEDPSGHRSHNTALLKLLHFAVS